MPGSEVWIHKIGMVIIMFLSQRYYQRSFIPISSSSSESILGGRRVGPRIQLGEVFSLLAFSPGDLVWVLGPTRGVGGAGTGATGAIGGKVEGRRAVWDTAGTRAPRAQKTN